MRKLILYRHNMMPYCKSMDFDSVDIYSFNKSANNIKDNFDIVMFVDETGEYKTIYKSSNVTTDISIFDMSDDKEVIKRLKSIIK